MKITNLFSITLLMTGFLSCSTINLATIPEIPGDQLSASYLIFKDEAYGSDQQQTVDIYVSNTANHLKDKNFTIIFLHGGGYYLSDKTNEEKYIQPYLKKGLNVVNVNYRLKRGIPLATQDLPNVINFLKAKNARYKLNLDKIVLTGFSAGAHIASNVGVGANNSDYPYPLNKGIKISAIVNFSGPVDGLDVVERIFIDNEMQVYKDIGNALFPSTNDYAPKDTLAKYEPITYFDKNDPSFFLWHGGKDDQIPPNTFTKFVDKLNENKSKNYVIFSPLAMHDPNAQELKEAYKQIFAFLDKVK